MQLDSVRELKQTLTERLPELGVLATADRPSSAVALGIAPTATGDYALAIRITDPLAAADVVDRLSAVAAQEIEVRTIGAIRALRAPTPERLRSRLRPLIPGASLAHPDVTAGTLGGFVTVDGARHVLSNNHVLGNSGQAAVGDLALQPGPADGGIDPADRIGTLTRFVALRTDAANVVDAAVVRLDDTVDAEPGAYPGGPVGAVAATPPADVAVQKVGRTTGHTRGRVTAFEVDGLRIAFPNGELVFDDQLEIEGDAGSFSAGGDSGSIVWNSADRLGVGLLFAGSETGGTGGAGLTYANPLQKVLDAFGAQWIAGT